jgi:hypothetical protein
MGKRAVSFLFPPVERIHDDVMYTMLMEAKEAYPDDVYSNMSRRNSSHNYLGAISQICEEYL